MLQLHNLMKLSHAVACPIVFILFYDQSWQGGVFEFMKTDCFSSVFSPLGHFSQVFGQVKSWLIIELYKMMKASHVAPCPVAFLLFHKRGWLGGVFKVMKIDHYLVFLFAWIFFPKFLGTLRSNLY